MTDADHQSDVKAAACFCSLATLAGVSLALVEWVR
jgi:hypothetical protein